MGFAKRSTTAVKQASKRGMSGLKGLASGLKSSFMMALVVVASATTPSCCKPRVACDFEQQGNFTEAVDIVSKRDDEKYEAAASTHNCSELTGASEIVVEHHAVTHKESTKLGNFTTSQTTFVEAPPPAVLMSQSSVLSTCFFDVSDNFDCTDIGDIEGICSTLCTSDDLEYADIGNVKGISSTFCNTATVPDNGARLSTDIAQAVDTAPLSAPAIVGDGGWNDNKLLIRSIYLEAVRRATGRDTPSKSLLGLDSPFPMAQPSLGSSMVAAH